MSEFDKSSLPDHELSIPRTYVRRVPQSVLDESTEALDQHLLKALDIGLIAMDSATAGLNMSELEEKMEVKLTEFSLGLDQAANGLNDFLEAKLVGEDSVLKADLEAVLGQDGSIAKLFEDMAKGLTDPDLKTSVSSKMLFTFEQGLAGELAKVTALLDVTKEDSPMAASVRTIKTAQTESANQMIDYLDKMAKEQTKTFNQILNGLELAKKDAEAEAAQKEALRKMSHKGVYFENDMLEALDQIRAASKWDDDITATGAQAVEGSLVKAGDIKIEIVDPALTSIIVSIAVEAKAGESMGLTEISREAKRGREARSTDAGIGVMVREARNAKQAMISSANSGKDSIVVVDWVPGEMNDDPAQWVALEAAYTITRARLIAEAVSDTGAIDADAIRKQANQVETDLGAFRNLKTKTTHAKKSVEAIENAVEALETKLKASIEELNALAKA
jgi:hypothetical protein